MQRKTAIDYINRIRASMHRILNDQNIEMQKPHIGASWAARVRLMGIRTVTQEELSPGYMRGYGKLSKDFSSELDMMRAELQALVKQLEGFLGQKDEEKLWKRVQRLDKNSEKVCLLQELERIIRVHGMIE